MPRNEATAVDPNPFLRGDSWAQVGPFDAKAVFVERWAVIKRSLLAHPKPGVLILAFDQEKGALAQAWLATSLDRTRAVIIGRHSMCSLALGAGHDNVSLRHIAVLVRATSHTESRIRLIDLHTPGGFTDEAGRVLQAVTSEGSLFVRIGGVYLLLLVTEEAGLIADDPEAQYACIPERVFFEERPGTAGEPPARSAVQGRDRDGISTQVRSQLGPLAAHAALCGEDEIPCATLIVRAGGGAARSPVSKSTLQRGFLVGRYARCDVGTLSEDSSRLSRVHLLVVKDGGDTLALDTASVNGTHVLKKAIELHRLADGDVLDLGGELELEWHE